MSPAAETTNQRYLRAGLAWLRGRFEAAGRDGPTNDARPGELDWTSVTSPDDPDRPALERLGDLFRLSRFERLVVLLCAAPELDPMIARSWAEALGHGSAYPTFGLALTVLPDPRWDALAASGPLRRWRLLELDIRPDQAVLGTAVRLDERVVDLVRDLDAVDARLDHLCSLLPCQLGDRLPASQGAVVEQGVAVWRAADPTRPPPVLDLIGPDAVVRAGLAAEIAARIGFDCYELDAEQVLREPDPARSMHLWRRETVLRPVALYVDTTGLRPEDARRLASLLVDAGPGVVVGSREPFELRRRPIYVLDAVRPTPAEQEQLWNEAFEAWPPEDAAAWPGSAQLAGRLDVNQVTIRTVAQQAARAGGRPAVWSACQAFTRPQLEANAQRLTTHATWDDLVLPDRERGLLHRMVDQVRGRATVLRDWGFGATTPTGTAVTALFAGQSGTGKTMAAGIVARDLDLALYRIDLSTVVSKYIGETERNLARVFDAADGGGAMLLFDEADALFGRRSEVKDSHDRYANIEVDYLLQRMDDFTGVAVLTTNQRHAVDQAFLRRLRFLVTFPFPSVHERLALWRRVFPSGTPLAPLDLDRLASLAATGGMIRNIALNAAFCAAGSGGPVSMPLLLEMARVEFQKLQLPVSDRDFEWRERIPEATR